MNTDHPEPLTPPTQNSLNVAHSTRRLPKLRAIKKQGEPSGRPQGSPCVFYQADFVIQNRFNRARLVRSDNDKQR
jgi:hypothetical protein